MPEEPLEPILAEMAAGRLVPTPLPDPFDTAREWWQALLAEWEQPRE